MRLTIKIAFALVLTLAIFFSIHSWQSVQRERVQIKASLSREARLVARTLAKMVDEIMERQGTEAALQFLRRASNLGRNLLVRWVWLGPGVDERNAPIDDEKLADAKVGEPVTILAETHAGEDYLFTYIPLATPEGRMGAIEVSESLEEMRGYVSESMRRSAFMLSAGIACSLLLITVIGSIWVDRPVKRLAAEADRIASGDFSSPLKGFGQDEFGELALALDRMRDQLASARNAEQLRLEALEKLRHTERLATLGRLSAGMAHELGTPLNVIAGRAKMLAAMADNEEVRRSAVIIGEQAERMTAIMRQLLNFARRNPPKKTPLNLDNLAAAVCELLRPTAEKQGITLYQSCDHPTPRVSADAGQLQQVLVNLAMNGIQAMPRGGNLTFRVFDPGEVNPPEEVAPAAGWVALSICDTGTGIEPDHLDHIFDPFFSTKDVGEGTGLGLSIAWGIARDHGGWIGVESTPGEGSCFTLYLPADQQHEKEMTA
ncbi:signal transduction histidine kinase [Geothermobacter ehrlichii]|uniref:histidine kinase n=1 Tax=Geothermobacter ehrlichii TaxID=213224 RepID=A0A5D3WM15_9BACT|nr:HAMP domain-containing sensor histidine kinase [Geothermobacter ehrlichii]TYO99334.1 signal transduction histidine kinase [Geothermobacter ehrlichii]